MDFLKEVLLEKHKSLKDVKRRCPEEELRMKLEEPRESRYFKNAISLTGELNIIGEIKKASPSEGLIREDFDPVQISRIYENCGIKAVSVLTEEKYFQGKIGYLNQVRKIVTVPILRKDFIFDIYQLYESKFFGADAVLLIAEVLKDGKLAQFLETAKRLELDCLVEVSNSEDLKYALEQNAEIIGINNRNLHTLEVDNKLAKGLISEVPKDKVIVVESGIKNHQEYLAYKKQNANALLIGSVFMKADDLKKKIKDLVDGPPKTTKLKPKPKTKTKLKPRTKAKSPSKNKTKAKTGKKKISRRK